MGIKVVLAVGVLTRILLQGSADEDAYAPLCTNVIAALGSETMLTSPAFTNQMHAYLSATNGESRSLAGLALSISEFSTFERTLQEKGLSDDRCRTCCVDCDWRP